MTFKCQPVWIETRPGVFVSKVQAYLSLSCSCADPENFVRGGQFFVVVVDEGWDNYKGAIIGPPAKHHLNGVLLACWWWPNIECWLGSFVIFQGGPDPLFPLLYPQCCSRMWNTKISFLAAFSTTGAMWCWTLRMYSTYTICHGTLPSYKSGFRPRVQDF